ncbi:MAG: hypothetical protein ACOY82_08080 [Pseudomonadota bacterium]
MSPTLPCPAERGPLLPVSLCAESRKAAEGLVVSFTLMTFDCAEGCERFAEATATEEGPCEYDPALKRYKVVVTAYGCRKVRDAEKIRKALAEQIHRK